MVEISDTQPGGLSLPPLRGVHALQQQAFVALPRHHSRRGAISHVRPAIIGIGSTTAGYAQRDHRAPVVEGHRLDVRKCGRLDAVEFVRQILDRAGSHRLANHGALVGDADEDEPAEAIEHGARRARRVRTLPGGALELHLLGLAAGDDAAQLFEIHRQVAPALGDQLCRSRLRRIAI